MKKLLFGSLLLALVMVTGIPWMARAEVNVSIVFPPPIVFSRPPELVVVPETYVYVVPDIDADIYFYRGWWWRLWEGRWYRSRHYDSNWSHYRRTPSFYAGFHSGWRNDYRERRWKGHQWNYQRIPHQQVQQNWKGWEKNRHWEKQQTWGVQGLRPQTRTQQRETVRPQQREAVRPERREAVKPEQRETVRPQRRESVKPEQRETVRPERRESVKPQQRGEGRPGQREGRPERSEQRQKSHEREDGDKKDRR